MDQAIQFYYYFGLLFVGVMFVRRFVFGFVLPKKHNSAVYFLPATWQSGKVVLRLECSVSRCCLFPSPQTFTCGIKEYLCTFFLFLIVGIGVQRNHWGQDMVLQLFELFNRKQNFTDLGVLSTPVMLQSLNRHLFLPKNPCLLLLLNGSPLGVYRSSGYFLVLFFIKISKTLLEPSRFPDQKSCHSHFLLSCESLFLTKNKMVHKY